jgi:hypothetical protein
LALLSAAAAGGAALELGANGAGTVAGGERSTTGARGAGLLAHAPNINTATAKAHRRQSHDRDTRNIETIIRLPDCEMKRATTLNRAIRSLHRTGF